MRILHYIHWLILMIVAAGLIGIIYSIIPQPYAWVTAMIIVFVTTVLMLAITEKKHKKFTRKGYPR